MHRRNLTFLEPLTAVARPAPAEPAAPPAPVPMLAPAAADAGAAAALRSISAALAAVVDELGGQRRRTSEETAHLSVELGVAIAERLLYANIAANRQRLDEIVRAALERMPSVPSVRVRAHPDDIALLERQLADTEERDLLRNVLTLRPDGSLTRGNIKLEADDWFMIWDTQRSLTELRDALLEEALADEYS